jgi:hypothetical protein
MLTSRSELILANSSIPQDVGSLTDSYSPSSPFVINSSPSSQHGFYQTMPGPILSPSIKSETAKIPRGYSVDRPSVQSEAIYELEGNQLMENAPPLSNQGLPYTRTPSEPSKSSGFLDHQLPPISETRVNHDDKPSFSSMRSPEPLFQGLSSRDTDNTSSMSGEVHGGYDPFNYTTDHSPDPPGSAALSASKLDLFSAIDDTSNMPTKALQTFSRLSDPSKPSASASRPNLSNANVTLPPKRDTPPQSAPQDLFQSLGHLNHKKPEKSPGQFVERQNFPDKNGKVREINSTKIEETEPICSNPITPVSSFSGDGIVKSTIATIKLIIIGDGNCGKTSLLMYVR